MPAFEALSPFLLGLACFLFASFTVCFVLADAFMTVIFLTPKTLGHIKRHELRSEGLWALLRKPFVLLCLVALFIGLAYLIEPNVGRTLVSSPISLFCWAMVIPILIFVAIFRREDYLDVFYMNIFMEFATANEQERYSKFMNRVDLLSISDAQLALENDDLSYLEKKALKERILMLSEPANENI